MAIIFTDLGFGDGGKGATIEHFARSIEVSMVVRYNGGPQAAHNVVTSTAQHTFSQFCSATLVSKHINTFLAPEMLVSLHKLEREASQLATLGVEKPLARIYTHTDCLLLTPYHAVLTKLKELSRGQQAHGTCGIGVGTARAYVETVARSGPLATRAPTVGSILSKALLVEQLTALQHVLSREAVDYVDMTNPEQVALMDKLKVSPEELAEYYCGFADKIKVVNWEETKKVISRTSGTLLFEPGQGVLLDELHGFHPHNTWSDTTPAPAHRFLESIGYEKAVSTYGIIRALHTRHGNGPLPSEDEALTAALPDKFNTTNKWQGNFRVGHFDFELFRYALAVVGQLDGLCVTHLDYLDHACFPGPTYHVVSGYKKDHKQARLKTDFRQTFETPNMSNTALLGQVELVFRRIQKTDFLPLLEIISSAPIVSIAKGPTAQDRAFTTTIPSLGITASKLIQPFD